MKSEHIEKHAAPPVTPTARQALAGFAERIRNLGIKLPLQFPTAGPSDRGLALALVMVEEDIEKLDHVTPRDNPAHRALFSLPPIQTSASTDIAVPEMPLQKVVTGDVEIDAVLWLREVIGTGQADLIAKAREAITRIKTPLKEVEKRYTDYLHRTQPGNFGAVLMSFGFADIQGWIDTSIVRATRRHEAQSRFGDDIFKDTPAEMFCIDALKGLRQKKPHWNFDEKAVDKRFDKCVEQIPGTLTDCILELTYWNDLYWLRDAVERHGGDVHPTAHARQDYVFRMLSRIPPRDPEEAAEVLRYLASNDGMDRAQTGSILMNLVGAPEPYHPHEYGDAQ